MGNTHCIDIDNKNSKNKTTNSNEINLKIEKIKTIKDNENDSLKINDDKNDLSIHELLKDDEFWLDG